MQCACLCCATMCACVYATAVAMLILQVVIYLRGNKKLNIPPDWKRVIDLAVQKVMLTC